MSESATADAAATTDWRTYDGVVSPQFIFHVVFVPLLLATCIVLPTAVCYLCLCRRRPVPVYSSPNSSPPGTTCSRFHPSTRSGGGGGFPSSSSPMWPSFISSVPSPTRLVNKSPAVGAAAAAAAARAPSRESTLVAEPSPAGRLQEKSPGHVAVDLC